MKRALFALRELIDQREILSSKRSKIARSGMDLVMHTFVAGIVTSLRIYITSNIAAIIRPTRESLFRSFSRLIIATSGWRFRVTNYGCGSPTLSRLVFIIRRRKRDALSLSLCLCLSLKKGNLSEEITPSYTSSFVSFLQREYIHRSSCFLLWKLDICEE